jgi:hypothetical protein
LTNLVGERLPWPHTAAVHLYYDVVVRAECVLA